MSDFTAGFASRLDEAARALALSYAVEAEEGFAPRDLKARAGRASSRRPTASAKPDDGEAGFSPQPVGARFAQAAADAAAAAADPDGFSPTEPAHFIDPIAEARAEGYAQGFHEGHEQGELERERDQATLRGLGEALKSAERVDRDLVAGRLRQTVLFLVSKIIGDIGVSPELLTKRIEAATDLIADGAENATLRVNPEDLPLLKDSLPAGIHPLGDALIERGSFVLESASTLVEDGPDLWLEQLAQAIERVGVPPLC